MLEFSAPALPLLFGVDILKEKTENETQSLNCVGYVREVQGIMRVNMVQSAAIFSINAMAGQYVW